MFKKKTCPEENKICAYCEHAEVIADSGACICTFKGIVHDDSVCRKFSFDLLKYKPHIPKLPESDISPLDF